MPLNQICTWFPSLSPVQDGSVVVADFGLARVLMDDSDCKPVSSCGRGRDAHHAAGRKKRYTMVGTAFWMAPEMLKGNSALFFTLLEMWKLFRYVPNLKMRVKRMSKFTESELKIHEICFCLKNLSYLNSQSHIHQCYSLWCRNNYSNITWGINVTFVTVTLCWCIMWNHLDQQENTSSWLES